MSSVNNNSLEHLPSKKANGLIHFDLDGKIFFISLNVRHFLLAKYSIDAVVGKTVQQLNDEGLTEKFYNAKNSGEANYLWHSPFLNQTTLDIIFFLVTNEEGVFSVTAHVSEISTEIFTNEVDIKKTALPANNTTIAEGVAGHNKMNYFNETNDGGWLLESISKSIPAAVYVLNLENYRLDFINEYVYTLTGYAAEEILAMDNSSIASFIETKDLLLFRRALLKTIAANNSAAETVQLFIKHKTGERRMITLTLVVFQRNNRGKVSRILGSATDITKKYNSDRYQEYVARLTELQFRKNQKLRSLSLLQGQEEERKRLARELHDGIGQLLTAIRLKLNSLEDSGLSETKLKEELGSVKELVSKTIKEVRTISYALVPIDLFDFGLEAAITQLCESADKSGLPTTFQCNLTGKRLNPTIEIEIYRIAQEGINNSLKYSKATSLDVRLVMSENAGNIKFILIDNGVGFLPDQDYIYKPNVNRSFGLRNMHERARIINGKLTIISAKGEGCVITLEAPLKLKEI